MVLKIFFLLSISVQNSYLEATNSNRNLISLKPEIDIANKEIKELIKKSNELNIEIEDVNSKIYNLNSEIYNLNSEIENLNNMNMKIINNKEPTTHLNIQQIYDKNNNKKEFLEKKINLKKQLQNQLNEYLKNIKCTFNLVVENRKILEFLKTYNIFNKNEKEWNSFKEKNTFTGAIKNMWSWPWSKKKEEDVLLEKNNKEEQEDSSVEVNSNNNRTILSFFPVIGDQEYVQIITKIFEENQEKDKEKNKNIDSIIKLYYENKNTVLTEESKSINKELEKLKKELEELEKRQVVNQNTFNNSNNQTKIYKEERDKDESDEEESDEEESDEEEIKGEDTKEKKTKEEEIKKFIKIINKYKNLIIEIKKKDNTENNLTQFKKITDELTLDQLNLVIKYYFNLLEKDKNENKLSKENQQEYKNLLTSSYTLKSILENTELNLSDENINIDILIKSIEDAEQKIVLDLSKINKNENKNESDKNKKNKKKIEIPLILLILISGILFFVNQNNSNSSEINENNNSNLEIPISA